MINSKMYYNLIKEITDYTPIPVIEKLEVLSTIKVELMSKSFKVVKVDV